jgi:hypothetical protein
MRRVEKEVRGVLLSEVEDSFSLKDILYLLLYAVRRGVELFAEIIINFQYLLTVALSGNRIRRII